MRTFVSSLALLSCLAGCAGEASQSRGAPAETAENNASATGRVGSHGMVVAGTPAEAFISHIPMFGAPHDVQVVVAGRFISLNGSSSSLLPESFSEKLFTFVPERMSLDALRLGSLQELRGTLFLGNFEAGGRPVTSVRFQASRVVHQHVLESGASQPELTYVLFGSRERTFAAHKIAGSPGFDEVLRVDLGGDAPPTSDLAAGVEARVSGKSDAPAARLGLSGQVTTVQSGARTFTVKSAAMLSCLEGPDFASACN